MNLWLLKYLGNKMDPFSDRLWWVLIELALKHSARVTGLRSARWERKSVFICLALVSISAELVQYGVLPAWPGGSRRLQSISDSAVSAFRSLHGCFYTDP